jgi:two-component system, response regulator PdtaR
MSTQTNHCPRILVVDDDTAIRRLTSYALRKAGFEVLEACTADEGARYVGDANIDAIVTDVEMPGALNGYDLAWRTHTRYPLTPLFVVSSSVGSDRRELPPHSRFFEKPVDPGILVAEMRAALTSIKRKRRPLRRSLVQPVA